MDIRAALAGEIAAIAELPENEILDMLETPPDGNMGDAALPCFKLAKALKKSPPQIAENILSRLERPEYISSVAAVGGYLNFFYDRGRYVKSVAERVLSAGEDWGKSDAGAGKTVVIDYSSINIAKPFHIGHLSSTAIGGALYRIYGCLGYHVVGVNHLGDWGTQFGKLIAAVKRWHEGPADSITVEEMTALYVRFHDEAEKDASLNEEGRAWFKRLEDGDAEAIGILERFTKITLERVGKIYEKLGISFDSYAGERFYNDKVAAVADELKRKNLLEESDGAYVVWLNDQKLPPAVILKSDGATLYITRDLAAAEYRRQTYDFHKNLYVVAYQQNLHFKQVFAVLKKMGYAWADNCEHVAFGMVSLEDGTLSTRKGKVVLLEDVLAQAVEKSLEIIKVKSPGLADKERVAEQVGIGAVVYSTLSQNRIKDITFSFDRVLDFDGETGPYVQYNHARCASLIAKAGERRGGMDFSALETDGAFAVLKLVDGFPRAIASAAEKNEPFHVTRHITALAQAFSRYYFECKIIDGDEEATNARIAMTRMVKNTIGRGLMLLGMAAPEAM